MLKLHVRMRGFTFGISTRVRAEVSGLVHVVPQSIDVNTRLRVEELQELPIPVLLCVWVEPIGEDSWARPHGAFVERAVRPLLENLEFSTVVVTIVITSPDSRVDHDDVMLLVGMEVIDELTD
jgi:hypothetical protein